MWQGFKQTQTIDYLDLSPVAMMMRTVVILGFSSWAAGDAAGHQISADGDQSNRIVLGRLLAPLRPSAEQAGAIAEQARGWAQALALNGSWPDIDYYPPRSVNTRSNWPAVVHVCFLLGVPLPPWWQA